MSNDKQKILRIRDCASNIAALENAFQEAAVNGTASATISANGGSKSYTKLAPEAIMKLIGYWKIELAAAKRSLLGRNANPIRSVMITRN